MRATDPPGPTSTLSTAVPSLVTVKVAAVPPVLVRVTRTPPSVQLGTMVAPGTAGGGGCTHSPTSSTVAEFGAFWAPAGFPCSSTQLATTRRVTSPVASPARVVVPVTVEPGWPWGGSTSPGAMPSTTPRVTVMLLITMDRFCSDALGEFWTVQVTTCLPSTAHTTSPLTNGTKAEAGTAEATTTPRHATRAVTSLRARRVELMAKLTSGLQSMS